MLLNIARVARGLGYQVVIIGPANPPDLIEAAADEGFTRIVLRQLTRMQYMVQLRLWHRAHRDALLWCNGLVPAAATGGRAGRIVHLHQLPTGTNAKLVPFARKKALQPSFPASMLRHPYPVRPSSQLGARKSPSHWRNPPSPGWCASVILAD